MKSFFGSTWRRLRHDWRLFPWKDVLPRMGADSGLVNASIVAAFLCWFAFDTMISPTSDPRGLARRFTGFAESYWAYWTVLALIIFYLNGFYTRSRGYAGRYKALVICRAVTLFMVIFVFSDYLFVRGPLIPRGVLVLGWAFTLVTVGGVRLGKDMFFKQYRLELVHPSSQTEKVLVVGGAGYLGSELVMKLLQHGYVVRVLDSLLFGSKSLERVQQNPKYELVVGDVRDIEVIVSSMKGCGAVIHLAAIVGDPACEADKALAVEVNRAATRMLIDIARGYNVRRFLFASTCSVYGASDFLVDEKTRPCPISTYAHTKVDSENLLLSSPGPAFHPTILRLGTLFGLSPRPRFDLVVNLLTAQAATTGQITVYNGEQWRPFLHVSDAAEAFALVLAASTDVVSGQIFNVGDYDLNHTLSEVSETIARIIPTVRIKNIDNTDLRNYRASFDKIHRRLGFECKRTLEDGIREMCDAISSMQIADFTDAQFNNLLVTQTFASSEAARRSSVRVLHALAQTAGEQIA
jgi:nucleoside-diphosphate-sugar epimerase